MSWSPFLWLRDRLAAWLRRDVVGPVVDPAAACLHDHVDRVERDLGHLPRRLDNLWRPMPPPRP